LKSDVEIERLTN